MKPEKQNDQQILSISVDKIAPNPNQPRKSFGEDGIIKLADSIRQYGIMQPLCVRKIGNEFELISGERRLRAAKEIGLKEVPCILINSTSEKSAEMAIIENLMRENLTIFEEAEAIEALIDIHKQTQEKIAQKLSVSQSYIANKLRLLRLSEEERAMILRANLTERHARALLRIRDDNAREKALADIISKDLNVQESEAYIDKQLSNVDKSTKERTESSTHKSINSFYDAINRAIASIKSTGVKIKQRKVENDNYTEISILVPKSKANTQI